MSLGPLPSPTAATAPYWAAAAAGRLMLPRCRACGRFHHHPREWCPHCWGTELDWEEVSGDAVVVTFSVVQQAPSPSFVTPYVLAVVDLAEGPRMMANVVGCTPGEVSIGLPVHVTFERRGDIVLPQFQPAQEKT